MKSFASKLEELNIWAQSSALHFVDAHRDFGSSYESAKAFLDIHQELCLENVSTKTLSVFYFSLLFHLNDYEYQRGSIT